MLEMIKIREI